jgi:hypothetical protein
MPKSQVDKKKDKKEPIHKSIKEKRVAKQAKKTALTFYTLVAFCYMINDNVIFLNILH